MGGEAAALSKGAECGEGRPRGYSRASTHSSQRPASGLRRRARGLVGIAACLALAALPGCAESSGRSVRAGAPTTPAFDRLFELEARVVLEEPDSGLITEIPDLDVDAGGRLLIPEPAEAVVRVYDANGGLLAQLGAQGDGPGEFRRPRAAVFGPQGGVYVTDTAIPRVTRFTPSLELDTIFSLSRAYFGDRIERVADALVVFAMREGPDARLYDLYSSRGVSARSFHRAHPLVRSVPGWLAAARSHVAAGAGHIFIAENLLYPIVRYDSRGSLVDSVGWPPPSWRPASHPKPGAFVSPTAWSRFQRWRRSFTTISGLGVYGDSLLLVVHKSLAPEVTAYEEASYRLDVYRLGRTVEKLHQDVELPGPMLHAGRSVYLLLAAPPSGIGWTLARYRMRGALRPRGAP